MDFIQMQHLDKNFKLDDAFNLNTLPLATSTLPRPVTCSQKVIIKKRRWHFFIPSPEHFNASRLRTKNSSFIIGPISRLPGDVLFLIFALLAHGEKVRYWNWVTVTHVCKRWRTVALLCPLLWTQLNDFRSENMVAMYLERSRGALLRISFGKITDRSEVLKSSLKGLKTSRIRSLDISLRGRGRGTGNDLWVVGKLLAEILENPAVNLDMLVINNPSFCDHLLPPSILANEGLPLLKHFHVQGGRLPENVVLLKDLTTLHLMNLHTSDILSLEDLLSILRQCPTLQDLELREIGQLEESSDAASRRDLIKLPNLKKFVLGSISVQGCMRLLHSLELWADIDCDISCSSKESVFWLAKPFPTRQEMDCRNFTVAIATESITIEVLAKEKNGAYSKFLFCCSLNSSSRPISLDVLNGAFRWINSAICDSFWKTSNCLTVRVQSKAAPISEEAWISLLECLSQLSRISYQCIPWLSEKRDFTLEHLMAVLQSSWTSILCPNLKEIDLVGAYLYPSIGTAYSNLVKFLALRHVSGQRLETVKVIAARGTSEKSLTSNIRQYVGTVVWQSFKAHKGGKLKKLRKQQQQEKPDLGQIKLLFGIKFDRWSFMWWSTSVEQHSANLRCQAGKRVRKVAGTR